jgi:hypothetical protein
MSTGQDEDGVTGVETEDQGAGKRHHDLDLTGGEDDSGVSDVRGTSVVYLGKALGLEQRLGNVLRRGTEGRGSAQRERRRLGWRLRGDWPGLQAEEPRRACHGQPAQETSPRPAVRLWDMHGRPPLSRRCHARMRVGASIVGPGGRVNANSLRASGGALEEAGAVGVMPHGCHACRAAGGEGKHAQHSQLVSAVYSPARAHLCPW